MTLLVVLGTAVVLLTLPGALDRFGRLLPPREWAWLSTIGLGAGLALLEAVLLLRAAPTLLRAVGAVWLASACERVLRPLVAGGPALGWVAAAGAIALPAAGLVQWRQDRRLRARLAGDLWLGEPHVIAGHPVVVMPIARPLAASVEHRHTPSIIVSDGLLRVLDESRVEAVVRHEAAHLRHGHQRLLSLATVAESVLRWLPPVPRTAGAVRLALERWADEEAAASGAGARLAVRDSLLVLAGVSRVAGVAGFTDAVTLAARVAALECVPRPPRRAQHLLLYVPGTLAGVVAAPALVTWGGHVHMVLAMSGRCSR